MKLAKGCLVGGKLWPYQTKLKKIEMVSEQQRNIILILLWIFTQIYNILFYIFYNHYVLVYKSNCFNVHFFVISIPGYVM